jgi:hypothetical protein
MFEAIGLNRWRWSVTPVALALLTVTACGSNGEQASEPSPTDAGAIETQVASYLATKSEVDQQVADSVSATIAAQDPTATPEPLGSPAGKADEPASTPASEPTATANEVTPEPTATPQPPQPTATPLPPAPNPTPEPTSPPPSPTPEPPATISFERPDSGYNLESGEHLSFAQADASFDVAQFPARAFIRSGVYFGIAEAVSSVGVIESSFIADETGKIRITADASWNGVLRTKGWGSMHSEFRVKLGVVGPDGVAIKAAVVGGEASIDSDEESKPVSGNQLLVFEGLVEGGLEYTIQLIAICGSSGSANFWASDSECIFDNKTGDGGYVEWRSLTVEYLP